MLMRDININYVFENEDALQLAGLQNVQRVVRSMPIGWGPEKSSEGTLKVLTVVILVPISMHIILSW